MKKKKSECDENCAECSNSGTKNCVMVIKKAKKRNKKKKIIRKIT